MTLSVILPFFNADRYLDNTVRNLVEQQFAEFEASDWELIIVNDGSTDRSASDARNWAEKYPLNIILLEQANLGVSAARNAAMACAQGEYVYFIDADDILIKGALQLLVKVAEETKADLIRFGFESITPHAYDLQLTSPTRIAPASAKVSTPSVSDFLEQTRALLAYPSLWSVWSALFRREFIEANNLRFIAGLHIGEDKIFMWQTLLANPRLTLIEDCLYLYQVRSDNASNNTSIAHLRRRQESVKRLNEIECRLYLDNKGRMSPLVQRYFKIGMGHEIVDLVQYALAFNEPIGNINALMRKYHSYTGRYRISKRLLVNEKINATPRSKYVAWLATRFLLPIHGIFHRKEYREL